MKNIIKNLSVLALVLAVLAGCNRYEDEILPDWVAAPTVLNDDAYATYTNQITRINVLANDTVETDGVLTFGPAGNGLVLSDSVGFIYQPKHNFQGTDRFYYRYCSGSVCDSALVTVNIANPNPNCNLKATHDYVTTFVSQAVVIPVLANDVTCGLVRVVPKAPKHGTLAILPTNELRYYPVQNFIGMDSLEYEIIGPDGRRAAASVYIRVHSNCTITAVDDQRQIFANDTLHISPVANDNTCNATVSLQVINTPQHGTIQVLSNNRLQYLPITNFNGTDQVEYQICNQAGQCSRGVINISVLPPPINCQTSFAANPDSIGFAASIPGSSFNLDVLQNDIYCLNQFTGLTVIKAPANGTTTIITVGGKPQINYTKTIPGGSAYADKLTYQICMNVNGQTVCRITEATVVFW